MAIADVDESGTVDQAEFSDFLSKLHDKLDTDKMTEIFNAEDGD